MYDDILPATYATLRGIVRLNYMGVWIVSDVCNDHAPQVRTFDDFDAALQHFRVVQHVLQEPPAMEQMAAKAVS